MGVEIVRNVVCDRCGKKCSTLYQKKTLTPLNLTELSYTENIYHYTEMHLIDYDSRFDCDYQKPFILCGDCVDKLGEFLKRGRR